MDLTTVHDIEPRRPRALQVDWLEPDRAVNLKIRSTDPTSKHSELVVNLRPEDLVHAFEQVPGITISYAPPPVPVPQNLGAVVRDPSAAHGVYLTRIEPGGRAKPMHYPWVSSGGDRVTDNGVEFILTRVGPSAIVHEGYDRLNTEED